MTVLTTEASPNSNDVVNDEGDNGSGEPTLQDVLTKLGELEAKTDGKFRDFGRDMGKLRERVKTEQPKGEEPSAPAFDLDVAIELVDFRRSAKESGLPDTVRSALENAIKAGDLSAADALSTTKAKGEDAKSNDPTPPPGKGAKPAPNTSGAHPVKMSELIAIRRDDKARYNKLMADPTFDPSQLR